MNKACDVIRDVIFYNIGFTFSFIFCACEHRCYAVISKSFIFTFPFSLLSLFLIYICYTFKYFLTIQLLESRFDPY